MYTILRHTFAYPLVKHFEYVEAFEPKSISGGGWGWLYSIGNGVGCVPAESIHTNDWVGLAVSRQAQLDCTRTGSSQYFIGSKVTRRQFQRRALAVLTGNEIVPVDHHLIAHLEVCWLSLGVCIACLASLSCYNAV